MMHFNAQSIRNKMELFRAMVASEELDIIGITESWINTSTRDFEGEFEVSGYKMFKKDREGRKGGGVLLYVRDYLNPVDCKIECEHEMLGVTLNSLGKCIYIILVYRPPHQLADRDEDLYRHLSNLIGNRTCLIVGDFNCPSVNWEDRTFDAEGRRLVEVANKEFLTQWVDKPTRGNNILDLVFSTEDNLVTDLTVGEKLGESDHNIVRLRVNIPYSKEENVRTRLNFRRANFSEFRESLRDIIVPDARDIDNLWYTYKSQFMEIQKSCIPNKQLSPSGKQQPKWYNREIAKAIKDRKRAHRSAKLQPCLNRNTMYKTQCKKVKKLVKKAKLEEELRVAEVCKTNPKEFFAHINSRKPIKNNIGPLKDKDGRIISSDLEMSNVLNDYFASVFTRENTLDIPEMVIRYEGDAPLENIDFTLQDVINKIRKLNKSKSPGPDGFLPRVVKEVEEEVAPHIYKILKCSVELSKAAEDWKLGNIAPIFKKGSKDSPGNYRPISLTSIICKILESIISDRIIDHLESNNLMMNSQHGFRHNRSCLTNLLDFFHTMFSIYDKTRAIDILYLDFQKAFDKVPHHRLMAKIRALGIVGKVADWIEDWLRNRKQRVVINGVSSEWTNVTSGVPQGSVLGPLLFIIYINDIDVGLVSKIAKFADDTKLGIDATDRDAVQELQSDLDKLGEWSEKWQMPFNVGKCKVMHVGYKNQKTQYSLLGEKIESTDQEKDLGVLISNDLKFSKQCIEAEKKAQKLLGYIKRQFKNKNKEIVLTLYNSLIRPHLEYAVQFWAPSLRKDINRLEAVQARATKLIPSIRQLGYQRRLKHLNLYSLETRRLRGQLIETFKILKGFNNINYRDLFALCNNQTRNNGWKIKLKRFNTDLCGNFFTYKIESIWNRLPAEVVNSSNVNQFKNKLDKILHTLG